MIIYLATIPHLSHPKDNHFFTRTIILRNKVAGRPEQHIFQLALAATPYVNHFPSLGEMVCNFKNTVLIGRHCFVYYFSEIIPFCIIPKLYDLHLQIADILSLLVRHTHHLQSFSYYKFESNSQSFVQPLFYTKLNSMYQVRIVFWDEKCAGAEHSNFIVTLNMI